MKHWKPSEAGRHGGLSRGTGAAACSTHNASPEDDVDDDDEMKHVYVYIVFTPRCTSIRIRRPCRAAV